MLEVSGYLNHPQNVFICLIHLGGILAIINGRSTLSCQEEIQKVYLANTASINPLERSGYIEVNDNFSGNSGLAASSGIAFSYTDRMGNSGSSTKKGSSSLCSTLGVILAYFQLFISACQVILKWESEAEINNKGLQIQATQNGVHFGNHILMSCFAAGGTTSQPLTYDYTDEEQLNGISYCRRQQVNINNLKVLTPQFKKVVSFNKTSIRIYPNPATIYIYIRGALSNAVCILYAMRETVLIGNGSKISVSSLTAGVFYVLQAHSCKLMTIDRFIKQ